MEKNIKKVILYLKSNIGVVILCLVSFVMLLFSVISSNYANTPIYIDDINDFINIEKTGMDKYYIITGYLTFENWTPLGSEENPFTGKLESRKPITIKSFNNNGKDNIGIFSVNKGVILGMKVYNPAIEQTFSNVNSFGYFAGINYGKITSCNVHIGCSNLSFENSENVSVGIFAGINYGDIRKCITTNKVTINTDQSLNFGYMCGESSAGIIELCSAKGFSTINAKSLNGGGICGVGSNTIFINNYVANTMNVTAGDSTNIGGFIGVINNKCDVINSYNGLIVNMSNTPIELRIGSIGRDAGRESSTKNCVTNLNVASQSNNFIYGSFFTDENHLLVDNCYYITTTNSLKSYYQGSKISFCELNLQMLGWDSAIWSVSCSGIESVIVYERS